MSCGGGPAADVGLLFQKRFHAGILAGSITLTFRRWTRPMVKPMGRYRCHPIGVLEVTAVSETTPAQVTAADARKSGFASRDELFTYLGAKEAAALYRVAFRHAGDEDARPVAFEAPGPSDIEEIDDRLHRLDRASPVGRWTRSTLELIGKHPHRRAGDLAELLGRERLDFKEDVRKLKRLGLTISHEVGYSLSLRGQAYLKATRRRRS